MENYEEVCRVSDIPKNEMKGFVVKGKNILIANLGGDFFAMDAVCSHMKNDRFFWMLFSVMLRDPEELGYRFWR